jgi:NAD-dependent DNA ligase
VAQRRRGSLHVDDDSLAAGLQTNDVAVQEKPESALSSPLSVRGEVLQPCSDFLDATQEFGSKQTANSRNARHALPHVRA